MSRGGTTDAIRLYPPDKLQTQLHDSYFAVTYINGIAYFSARTSSCYEAIHSLFPRSATCVWIINESIISSL